MCLVGAGELLQTLHTATGIKTHIFTQKTPKNRRFYIISILIETIYKPLFSYSLPLDLGLENISLKRVLNVY